MEFRKTSDDPNSSPTWSAWQGFDTGTETRTRAAQFRLFLNTDDSKSGRAINHLEVIVEELAS